MVRGTMLTIRRVDDGDRDAVLALAARAWEPVFDSVNGVLGPDLARRLHGEDWRVHHSAQVADILGSETTVTWVAEIDGQIVGFAAARIVDGDRGIGEVNILGVDPAAQRSGVGAELMSHAESWLREKNAAVAYIDTGGDEGHAPARRLYEQLGYRAFPVVQYYKVLSWERDD
jgi:GNAT superfamily N-acetyltransferase